MIPNAEYYHKLANSNVNLVLASNQSLSSIVDNISDFTKTFNDYGLTLTGVKRDKSPCHGKGWQSKAHTTDEIKLEVSAGNCVGLGLICGLDNGKGNSFLILDIDGATAFEKLGNLELKKTLAVTSGTSDRVKLIYRIPSDFRHLYKANKYETKPGNKDEREQLEVLLTGNQGIIYGFHEKSGGYYKFIEGHSLKEFPTVELIPTPPNLLEHSLKDYFEPKQESKQSYQGDINDGILDKFKNNLPKIDCNNSDYWLKVTAAAAYHAQLLEGEGKDEVAAALIEVWDNWSKLSGKYEENENFTRFNSLRVCEPGKDPLTVGTVIELAAGKGDRPKPKPSKRKPRNLFSSIEESDKNLYYTDEFIIHGVLGQGLSLEVMGLPLVGKSTLVMDMVASVVTGKPFLGHKVKQGKVLIFAPNRSETAKGQLLSLGTWDKNKYNDRVTLLDETPTLDTLQDIRYTLENDPEIRLVVLDTLADYIAVCGAKENNADDMKAILKPLIDTFKGTNAGFIAVHHAGKGGVDGYTHGVADSRGSTAITAEFNSYIGMYGNKTNPDVLAKIYGHNNSEVCYLLNKRDEDDIYNSSFWSISREVRDGEDVNLKDSTSNQILNLLNQGERLTNKEISTELKVALNTVRSATSRLFSKGHLSKHLDYEHKVGKPSYVFFIKDVQPVSQEAEVIREKYQPQVGEETLKDIDEVINVKSLPPTAHVEQIINESPSDPMPEPSQPSAHVEDTYKCAGKVEKYLSCKEMELPEYLCKPPIDDESDVDWVNTECLKKFKGRNRLEEFISGTTQADIKKIKEVFYNR